MPKDNSHFDIKLDIRKKYLNKYGGNAVLDCCQGDMRLWGELRKEYPNLKYMGVDLKPKRGRHKVDSARLLKIEGIVWDVVDIDTYGNPFDHYQNLCTTLNHECTVFLTYGTSVGGLTQTSNAQKSMIGLPRKTPTVLAYKAVKKYIDICIHSCRRYGIIPSDIIEVKPSDTVCYYAMRLKKQENVS